MNDLLPTATSAGPAGVLRCARSSSQGCRKPEFPLLRPPLTLPHFSPRELSAIPWAYGELNAFELHLPLISSVFYLPSFPPPFSPYCAVMSLSETSRLCGLCRVKHTHTWTHTRGYLHTRGPLGRPNAQASPVNLFLMTSVESLNPGPEIIKPNSHSRIFCDRSKYIFFCI